MERLQLLSKSDLEQIHSTSLTILQDIGVQIPNREALAALSDSGAQVDLEKQIVRIPAGLMEGALRSVGKQFILHGRDRSRTARFGYGDFNFPATAAQVTLIDGEDWSRREATLNDFRDAVKVCDALEHVNIAGGMGLPREIAPEVRDIYMAAEMIKMTPKPSQVFASNVTTLRIIIEIYETVAGGASEHRQYPMMAGFIEPISPLRFDRNGSEILVECAKKGIPIVLAPMVQSSATGPATLAGTLAQENAEILAGIALTQAVQPGLAIGYGGSCHTMDLRTMLCSFGAPEQVLLGIAMAQLPLSYGLPVLFNAGLTDSKRVDVQAGLEKGMTLLSGALAGIETFAHMGICGADQGASLEQLIIDDATAAYVKRVLKGIAVTPKTLALDAIRRVGIGGNFLTDDHTLDHFRDEVAVLEGFDRQNWDSWAASGSKDMLDWAREKKRNILKTHEFDLIDEKLGDEIDRIVARASG